LFCALLTDFATDTGTDGTTRREHRVSRVAASLTTDLSARSPRVSRVEIAALAPPQQGSKTRW
jgi:hypothetical protein